MWGLAVFVLIVILSSAVGAISQWLKAQQQAEEERVAQSRLAAQNRTNAPPRTNSDRAIDRYMEEVERLRRKSAGDPRAAPPTVRSKSPPPPVEVPVVPPAAKRRRVSDDSPPPFASKRSGPRATPPPAPVPPAVAGSLPFDSLAADPPIMPGLAGITAGELTSSGMPASRIRLIARAGERGPSTTPLAELLRSKQALPLAIMLHEILGPPKCKQPPG